MSRGDLTDKEWSVIEALLHPDVTQAQRHENR